jgi:hypothetical protein
MSLTRDKTAEREGQITPFEDYLMIEIDKETGKYGVRFSRNYLTRESAIKQYRTILKALYQMEVEDEAKEKEWK